MKIRHVVRVCTFCLALCLFLPCFSACGFFREKKYEFSYFQYFDTFSSITVYAKNREQAEGYSALTEQLLSDYHRLLDCYQTYDGTVNLCQLNAMAGQAPVAVDPRLFDFLRTGKELCSLTRGITNLCLGSVLSLWHKEREAANQHPQEAKLPAAHALSEAAAHTDMADLILDEEAKTVQISDPLLSLDGGALAKGYVAERLREALQEAGCTAFLINLGGNLLGIGGHANGAPWLCGIEDPTHGEGGFQQAVRLSGQSLVTTGSYHRYYTVGGKQYCHVIDPRTSMPADHFLSVSILCSDSARADALSTALFCLSYEEGLALIGELEQTEALWILPDGSVRMSPGFGAHVEEPT